MANYDKAVERLQQLLTEQDLIDIPHQVDDKIIIGHVMIKPTKRGLYIVIDRQHNTSELFQTKLCAIAYAKNIKKTSVRQKVIAIDKFMAKHNNDCVFYKNTIKKTKTSARKIVAENRYHVSQYYVKDCKEKLYNLIFN